MTNEEIKTLKGRGWLLNKGGGTFSARVVTVNGKMTAEQMQALAAAAQRFGRGEVALTSRMSVEVGEIVHGRALQNGVTSRTWCMGGMNIGKYKGNIGRTEAA